MTVPLGTELVSEQAFELCGLQLAYCAIVCISAAVLFVLQTPFVSTALLFGLSALNALRVTAFAASMADPHMSNAASVSAVASLVVGCALNTLAAVLHSAPPKTLKKKQKRE